MVNGIRVRDLVPGDLIIFDYYGTPKEVTVKFNDRDRLGMHHIYYDSTSKITRSGRETIQRGVRNLVPTTRRNLTEFHRSMSGIPYEVLVFFSEDEYEKTRTEPDFQKRIAAAFRNYSEALDYAQRRAVDFMFSHVILRLTPTPPKERETNNKENQNGNPRRKSKTG